STTMTDLKTLYSKNIAAEVSELKLLMFISEHNLPFRILEHLPKLIQSICPDSKIVKEIKCSRTKGTRILKENVALYSIKEICNILKTTKFSLIIDETTHTSIIKSLVVVRYFDTRGLIIKDRFLTLLEVKSCTTEDLYNSIEFFFEENGIPTRKPLITRLLTSIEKYYIIILKCYFNNDYVNNTPIALIDPANARNYLEIDKMYFGAKPDDLHFPFKINNNEWQKIEKIITINAYCDAKYIFTILQFPLITIPKYELINVIPLPVNHNKNVFVYLKIKNPLIAVYTEGRSYLIINNNNLKNCKTIYNNYICSENFEIRRANLNPTCEIEIYLGNKEYDNNCEIENKTSNNTVWIPLNNPHSWLFATTKKEQILIKCKDHGQIKETIENTGKISLQVDCKLITSDTTLQSQKTLHETVIESFMPEYNIFFLKNEQQTKTDRNE
ncbi:hypothetical protein ALC62_00804, partial [Cyphomyrmex costatus]